MAAIQMMNSIHSVHALVRLLKSSTDPPCTPGPSKIEIASLAWSDPSFHAANKGEVIGEWLLTQLGQAKKTRRERDVNYASDPIADSRYWTLLCSVLTTPPPTTARSIKTWLLPLLNRFQLDTLVVELLSFHSLQVLAPARVVLTVLWPLAEKKISIDALRECLSAVFDACAVWERVDDDMGWICSAVVGAYRNALANAGNKKKLYNSFLTTHLPTWLCVICTSPSLASPSSTTQLQDSIYAAGTDTLFSVDALKQPLDALFEALSSFLSRISSLLLVLPKLFASFLSATHRHKATLFVAAISTISAKEEVRKKGMEFVEKYWTLIQGPASLQEDFNAEKWGSVIGVLEIIEKERLFVTYSIRGMHVDATNAKHAGELALSEARDKAIEMLENTGASSEDHRVGQAVLSVQLLDVLVRIDYDFIGSILGRVLSALISIPPTISHLVTTPSSKLLIHVLEYHTKTRTVHTYALALLGAVFASSASFTSRATSPLSMMRTFPLAYHLPALACALRTSLTPTQTAPLAIAVLEAVESAWMAVKDTDRQGEEVAKKWKGAGDTDEGVPEARIVQAPAQAFSFIACIASAVLSNLSSNAYTEDGKYSLESLWSDAGKLGWTIIWDCLRERIGKGGGGDSRKRKHAVVTGTLSTLDLHTVTSAALRFLYDVRTRASVLLGDCDRLGEPDVETLLNVARDEESEPELVLGIIRTLFWHMWYTHNCVSQKQMEAQPIFTVTLDILTTCISSKSRWSGVSTDLTRDNLGLAILYVLTDRWIDVLDALAPTECLERLVSLLLAVSLDLPDEDSRENSNEVYLQRDHVVITLRGILFKLLQNAQFWELHNIRAVFLSSALNLTKPLSYCFPAAEIESPLPITTGQNELTLACNVYGLLCYVPPEYFTRPVRTELIKRAMTGDVQICAVLAGTERQRSKARSKGMVRGNTNLRSKSPMEESDDRVPLEGSESCSRRLTFVRTFLQRMGQFLNTANHTNSLAFIIHLLSPLCISSPSKTLTSVTLDLIQLHVVSLLRSQEPETTTSISSVISTVIAAEPFLHSNSPETWTHIIVQPTVLKLIERLIHDFDPASLPDEVKHSLNTLLQTLETVLSPHAQRSAGHAIEAIEVDQILCSERINAWSYTLSLARWLEINSEALSSPLGLTLVTSVIRSENSIRLDSETRSSVLRLLFEELCCMPDVPHHVHLDALAAFYVVNGGYGGSNQVEHTMDTQITQASKRLTVEDFSHLLEVLAEGIGGSGLHVSQRECLIHLGKVILHDAPQGTLKVIQNFVTGCLNLFTDREEIYVGGSSSLKMQCLEFIARHCSDRPVAIRSADLGNIWSLLNKVLSGSSEHDVTTTFPIFHHIVSIIGALIRLRRDLVVHTLPHLSLALRQLMMLTRKIRPQLGAKQNKIVTDTFPSWLSASQPLSTDEARALARLLTSLATKTVPRTYAYAHPSTSTESQKAESLAKPFAKHASYVLVAYVDAFNDPLCIMNAEMRRELEPGLFALCEMVGEHSRDTLMVSALDSGGKTIMKSLWRDYEKQRYVGKG